MTMKNDPIGARQAITLAVSVGVIAAVMVGCQSDTAAARLSDARGQLGMRIMASANAGNPWGGAWEQRADGGGLLVRTDAVPPEACADLIRLDVRRTIPSRWQPPDLAIRRAVNGTTLAVTPAAAPNDPPGPHQAASACNRPRNTLEWRVGAAPAPLVE